MAVPEQTPYSEHTGNGVTTSFSLGFQCESKDHLIVLVDEIEPPIATWSLTGGNVVFTTAPAVGKKITLQRNTPFNRNAEYQSFNNSFRPQTVNIDFDRIWWKLQELGVADWLMKLYVDRLHQQQEQKINDLKGYVDDRDDELRAYLLEEIRKQGVALDQLDEYYNYLMQRLAQIAVDKGWAADFVVDGPQTQREINLYGGKKYDMPVGGYPVNAVVILDNGDQVKSTITGNTNNPNTSMDGWRYVNKDRSVLDFGAIWNGYSHPISDWHTIGSANYKGYADLNTIKADYPFVTSGSDEIDFVATQAAVNKISPKGGVIHLPQGTGVFNRTINLTGLYGSHMTNLPVLHTSRLRFVGEGSANTVIKGGEVGYGFFEMLGANFIDFEGFTLNATNATNKCQYGICAGRPTGNASSGTYHFKDFHVYGFFTKAAHYMMSSETNVWEDCFYYPQTGHGVVLSMNNIGWAVTPKYSTFGTGLGGNGVNYMSRVHFLSHLAAAPSDILLAVEYGQVFRADTIYFASSNNEKHVQFRKAFGQTFINNAQHEQYGSVMPISYYFKGDDALDPNDYIDYRDFTLTNSRLFQIYAEDNVRITSSAIKNNVWRGPVGSYGIDVAKLYDSEIFGSDKMPNVTLNTNVKVRVRQENENNTWKGFKLENLDVPLLALDTVILPTDSSKVGEISGLDTRLSAVQSGGSAPITAVGTGDFSVYVDFVAPTIIDAQQRGVISFAGASTNMGSGRVLGAYFLNGALFIEYLNTSSNVITLRSVDPSILQRLGGKRMSLIITRTGATIKVYINGYVVKMNQFSLVGSATFIESIDGTFLMFGSRNSNVNSVAKGVYYSGALFNAILSDDGALNVHRNGALIATTCVGYWDFTSSTSTILAAKVGANGSIVGDGVLRVNNKPSASVVYDPPSLAAGAQQSTTVTLAGAAVGSAVAASFSLPLQGTQMWGEVTATNTITVYHRNGTAAPVDLASGIITVKLI